MNEHFGRVLWSNYFAARIVVVHYEDDETWWFVVEGRPQILKARTRLSEMPNVKVDRAERKPTLRNLDQQAARQALAYVAAEVGDTILDDTAWIFIRRAAGLDEVTASPREVVEALGFRWHEVAAWREQVEGGTDMSHNPSSGKRPTHLCSR